MKNVKGTIRDSGQDGAIDGGGLGLIVFVATAVWLLLFESNLFR